jgi:hypothetical protein
LRSVRIARGRSRCSPGRPHHPCLTGSIPFAVPLQQPDLVAPICILQFAFCISRGARKKFFGAWLLFETAGLFLAYLFA